MLRNLGVPREDGSASTRTGEVDPADSVFLVLLWYDQDDRKHFEIGSVWLGLGEAKGAAERYAQRDGSLVNPLFDYATVLEIQTGQMSPKGERHGDPYRRVVDLPPAPEDALAARIRELELDNLRLRAAAGTATTVGVDA